MHPSTHPSIYIYVCVCVFHHNFTLTHTHTNSLSLVLGRGYPFTILFSSSSVQQASLRESILSDPRSGSVSIYKLLNIGSMIFSVSGRGPLLSPSPSKDDACDPTMSRNAPTSSTLQSSTSAEGEGEGRWGRPGKEEGVVMIFLESLAVHLARRRCIADGSVVWRMSVYSRKRDGERERDICMCVCMYMCVLGLFPFFVFLLLHVPLITHRYFLVTYFRSLIDMLQIRNLGTAGANRCYSTAAPGLKRECVCMYERERERECVCMSVCVLTLQFW